MKHVLGLSLCIVLMFGVMLGSFFLAMSTFHNGPTSDYSFSKSQILAARVGYSVWRVLLWPGQQITSSIAGWFVSSAIYGSVVYGLLIGLRRRKQDT